MDTTQIPTVGTRPRILVVDDEYLATKRIAELLELSGYDADCALSPGECMAELDSGIGFDAVILDIGFGEEEPHGGEIAAEIRDRYGVPVVFYTAHTDRETIGLTRDTDSCGIVVKAPDDAEILLASVEAAIRRGRTERETIRQLDTYHEILQGMPVPVCVFDRSTGSQLFANDAAAGLVGAASLDEYEELFDEGWCRPAGEHPTATDCASGAAWTITGPLVDRSRGRHWLVATRGMEDGRTFVVQYDVTWLCEQVRRVEHEADAAKALLRDVHHRVKNNLAVVDALIDMAQQRLHEPETLRAVRAQVHAVRVLHERLHASQRHLEVDIAEYLEDIARSSLRADREARLETAFPGMRPRAIGSDRPAARAHRRRARDERAEALVRRRREPLDPRDPARPRRDRRARARRRVRRGSAPAGRGPRERERIRPLLVRGLVRQIDAALASSANRTTPSVFVSARVGAQSGSTPGRCPLRAGLYDHLRPPLAGGELDDHRLALAKMRDFVRERERHRPRARARRVEPPARPAGNAHRRAAGSTRNVAGSRAASASTSTEILVPARSTRTVTSEKSPRRYAFVSPSSS